MVARQPPDLILLDVMMPGMDGYQVAAKIKGNPATKNIPIIMVTALDDRDAQDARAERRRRGLSHQAGGSRRAVRAGAGTCCASRPTATITTSTARCSKARWARARPTWSRASASTARPSTPRRSASCTSASTGGGCASTSASAICSATRATSCRARRFRQLIRSEEAPGEAESFRQMAAGTLDRHVVDEKRYRRRDGSFVWARVNMSVHRDADGQAAALHLGHRGHHRAADARSAGPAGEQDGRDRAAGLRRRARLQQPADGHPRLRRALSADADDGEPARGTISTKSSRRRKRAAGLTQQLLAFSRQQVLHAAPLDVNGLITDMTGMLGRLIGEHIDVALVAGPRPVPRARRPRPAGAGRDEPRRQRERRHARRRHAHDRNEGRRARELLLPRAGDRRPGAT